MKTMKKLLRVIVPITAILSMGLTTSFAEETGNLQLPEPIKVLDFSKSFDELASEDEGFEVVENEASPVLVEDEDMGQVLQLNKGIIRNRYYESETHQLIDDSDYSTIKITNPYVGLDYLKEYENPYDIVETTEYKNIDGEIRIQPLWKEGITISYWIKVPADENGIGKDSNVLGFTAERFQMHCSDRELYIKTLLYDMEYNSLTDEERALLGPHVERCGVLPESEFYFEYAEEELYEGKPLYKNPEGENMGEMYYANKFYIPGYYKKDDGTIQNLPYSKEYYNIYKEAPRFGNTEDDHDPGDSNIRYTWTHGEMWLDTTSSFYFANCADEDKQLNPNFVSEYGDGYYNVDGGYNRYTIESWTDYIDFSEAVENSKAAPSPASMPEEWHNVCVVIQNDWVQFYFDGEEINILEAYGLGGEKYTEINFAVKVWPHFNKGTGSRGGYESIRNAEGFGRYFTAYASTTIMEWITMECTNLTIGGGDKISDTWRYVNDTDEIKLKNVVFYDKMLNAEQIEYLAENPFVYDSKIGDVNTDGVINADDALAVLKYAARLEDLQEYQKARGNVAGSEMLNAEDALEILKYAAGIVDGFGIK